ncbi:MAG: CoB--CoM heterodisulfide reductase iron-sulfur subunit A family protein [Deltaproteobacteria bacterium]|nr:CoB--CoM heterodisulfide reductase iron-sulfur subunit A family protein [Deltaproteobacteria bacterium]MBW2341039.1 CoB--CoM heterodisulfide reductase iron-sulfur subunit A family protein [Deltaproteobacteria bacterium]
MGSDVKKIKSVLVVGAGVAGVHAALDLADLDFKVYLIEKQPHIGGKMVQLYRTAEDNFALGAISPILLQAANNSNIEIITLGELDNIEGEPGEFTVSIRRSPRYVDQIKCVTCGLCWPECPVQVPSEFNYGLGSRNAIGMPYAGAVPNRPSIDPGTCLHMKGEECTRCVDVCPTGAINLDAKESIQKLKVGGIVLTPGVEPYYGSSEAKKLGHGKMVNVIDNFQMDRLVSIYGPTKGQVARPSDGKIAHKIAFIQCVGSRKPGDDSLEYCSSVCCMYSIRAAMSTQAKDVENDITIFHNDIMAISKTHEKVFDEATENGIKFIRGSVSSITEDPETNNLTVNYVSEAGGEATQEVFDLVVLSLGLIPSQNGVKLTESIGIPLNSWKFPELAEHSNLALPGIAVGGSFKSLEDTPLAVADSQAAAMEVANFLSDAEPENKKSSLPPELDVSGIPPRVGVYICECGGIISRTVDTEQLHEFAGTLDGVEDTRVVQYACYSEGMEEIQKSIKEKEINRVVMVACSYRSHLPKFQNMIRQVGLNKFLVEMVNARELCAWVNTEEKDKATERMKEEIKGIVAKVKGLEPLPVYARDVVQRSLVLGGGVAGMTAALSISSHRIPVDIVEKTETLGGNALRLSYNTKGKNVSAYIDELVKEINGNPLINVIFSAELREVRGRVGQFSSSINTPSGKYENGYGTIIVATGGREHVPQGYLYKDSKRVITQLELEEMIANDDTALKGISSAVVIHCVGSRNEERPYCSRVCCSQSVKNTLKLKEINPDMNIYHLHRDIRTYFLNDIQYRKAQEAGVSFIRYDEEKGLNISQDNGLMVKANNIRTGEKIELRPDLIILNAAMIPREDNNTLSRLLGVPLGEYNFFDEEDYMTFTPVDFSKKGVFLCGLSHGPKTIDESIAQAKAAAIRALSVLTKHKIVHQNVFAEVNPGKCIACLTCVRVCPFGVPFTNDDGVAEIVPVECRACGVCVSSCPNDAISLKSFTDFDVIPQIETMLA